MLLALGEGLLRDGCWCLGGLLAGVLLCVVRRFLRLALGCVLFGLAIALIGVIGLISIWLPGLAGVIALIVLFRF